MTITANTRPSRPSVDRSSIDRSTYGAWSNTTVISEASPSARVSPASLPFTSWEI